MTLLFVHLDLNIDFEHVIDEISPKNRKLNFNYVKFWHTASVDFFGSPITITNQFVWVNALGTVV